MRSGRLAEFLSQRKVFRSFFVVAMVLEFGILILTRLLRSGSLEGYGWVLSHDWRADPEFGGLHSGFGTSVGGGFPWEAVGWQFCRRGSEW